MSGRNGAWKKGATIRPGMVEFIGQALETREEVEGGDWDLLELTG